MRRRRKDILKKLFLLLFLSLFLSIGLADAKTTVTQGPGKCTVTVTVNIAIHGPNATQELADRWKRNIENLWNGPTNELTSRIANANRLDPNNAQNRERINNLAKEYLRNNGVPGNCSYVNCCNICFRVNIRLLSDVIGEEGYENKYHRIEVVPEYQTRTVDGREVREWTRSFVMGLNGQGASTTGTWGDDQDGSWPPEAHEVGHLMGLEDQYHDDAAGHSVTHEGHQEDLMANCLGWPWEDAINRILEIAGVSCNCCDSMIDSFYQRYGRVWRPANDAIITCNLEVLQQALNDLLDQKRNLEGRNVPITLRYDIDRLIEKIEQAIRDCGPRDALIIDSGQWCTYWGGEVTVPPTVPPVTVPPTGVPPTGVPPETPPTTGVPPTVPPVVGPPVVGPPVVVPPSGHPVTETPITVPSGEDKPKEPPTVYVKADKSVLKEGGGEKVSALPGIMIKFSSTKAPDLPVAGAKKDDKGYSESPIQGVTGPDGQLKLSAKPETKEIGEIEQSNMYAMFNKGETGELIVADVVVAAKQKPKDEKTAKSINILIRDFKSYIAKIKIDKNRKNWDKPEAYLDPSISLFVVRKWIAGDSMYVVINIPTVVKE